MHSKLATNWETLWKSWKFIQSLVLTQLFYDCNICGQNCGRARFFSWGFGHQHEFSVILNQCQFLSNCVIIIPCLEINISNVAIPLGTYIELIYFYIPFLTIKAQKRCDWFRPYSEQVLLLFHIPLQIVSMHWVLLSGWWMADLTFPLCPHGGCSEPWCMSLDYSVKIARTVKLLELTAHWLPYQTLVEHVLLSSYDYALSYKVEGWLHNCMYLDEHGSRNLISDGEWSAFHQPAQDCNTSYGHPVFYWHLILFFI